MMKLVAGVDEAGRGPLAGPVFAAAVVLDPHRAVWGLDDSKKLSERQRINLEHLIKEYSLSWCVAQASVEEIDEINILQATMLAMSRAVAGLKMRPHSVLVDGNRVPDVDVPAYAVVRGDSIHAQISAASILAKQARDRMMVELSQSFPQYGFDKHKGYPTKAHVQALRTHGATHHHRRSFAPVRALLE